MSSSPARAPDRTVSGTPLLEVRSTSKRFGGKRRLIGGPTPTVRAVHEVDLALYPGDSLGVVGESGCGKSTLARMIMGIIPPSEGQIYFRGRDVTGIGAEERKALYRSVQFVFQDPQSSLNPRKTVRQILETPMVELLGLERRKREERLLELMDLVNMRPEFLDRHPHEFSGGQAQRIGIARALAPEPELLILDEPVSALDVSIQAQILKLLLSLKRDLNLTYLFISHDLAVVDYLCDRVAVMYLGSVVEHGTGEQIFDRPRHPYTHVLLGSVPEPGNYESTRLKLEGELPDPSNPPAGCPFAPRCYRVQPRCWEAPPPLVDYGEGHEAACYFADNPEPPPEKQIPGREEDGPGPGRTGT
jgi:peptide/nickel transport system ATP-binding protein